MGRYSSLLAVPLRTRPGSRPGRRRSTSVAARARSPRSSSAASAPSTLRPSTPRRSSWTRCVSACRASTCRSGRPRSCRFRTAVRRGARAARAALRERRGRNRAGDEARRSTGRGRGCVRLGLRRRHADAAAVLGRGAGARPECARRGEDSALRPRGRDRRALHGRGPGGDRVGLARRRNAVRGLRRLLDAVPVDHRAGRHVHRLAGRRAEGASPRRPTHQARLSGGAVHAPGERLVRHRPRSRMRQRTSGTGVAGPGDRHAGRRGRARRPE